MLHLFLIVALACTTQTHKNPTILAPSSSTETQNAVEVPQKTAAPDSQQSSAPANSTASTATGQSNPDGQSAIKEILPDKPIPHDIIPREACPYGDPSWCGNFGGKQFFRNTTLTEHDRTWRQAMSHPSMWLMATALVASTAFDAEGTHYCLQHNACTEGNPLMGKHPNRARLYGIAMPLNAIGIYTMGRLKMHGQGFVAAFVPYIMVGVHSWFGVQGFGVDDNRRKGTK